jgi:hypothetical protein
MAIEAMKHALEALTRLVEHDEYLIKTGVLRHFIEVEQARAVITALRKRMVQPEDAPVAYRWNGELFHPSEIKNLGVEDAVPLYSAPRQWVGLTDDEAMQIWDGVIKYALGEVRVKAFALAIEAKLKENNT